MVLRLDKHTHKLGKLTPDKNGFLRLDRVRATRAGVFIYRDKTGKVTRELRPREEVFKQDSMNTLTMKPFSLEHKGGLLTSKTVKDHSVGSTGESVREDGLFLEVSVAVHNEEGVSKITKQDALDVSAGYECDIEETSGVDPEFGPYDKIQRNIVYNHLTSTIKGRGEGCSIRLDSGAWQVDETEQSQPEGDNLQEESRMKIEIPPFTIGEKKFDSFPIEIPDGAEVAVQLLRNRMEDISFAAKELLSGKDAKFDSVTDELSTAKKELEERNDSKLIEEKAGKLADEKLKVWEGAKSRMDSKEFEAIKNEPLEVIKKAVLAKKEGLDTARMDSDSAYLDAAFDQFLAEKPSRKSEKFDFDDTRTEGMSESQRIQALKDKRSK